MSRQNDLLGGAAAEYRAAYYFLHDEYEVFWPAMQHLPYDFMIHKDGSYQKVQVKLANARGVATLTTKSAARRRAAREQGRPLLEAGMFDLLAVVTRSGGLWVIPEASVPHDAVNLNVSKETWASYRRREPVRSKA